MADEAQIALLIRCLKNMDETSKRFLNKKKRESFADRALFTQALIVSVEEDDKLSIPC